MPIAVWEVPTKRLVTVLSWDGSPVSSTRLEFRSRRNITSTEAMSTLPVLATVAESRKGVMELGSGRLLVTEVMATSVSTTLATKASAPPPPKAVWKASEVVKKLVEAVAPVT